MWGGQRERLTDKAPVEHTPELAALQDKKGVQAANRACAKVQRQRWNLVGSRHRAN